MKLSRLLSLSFTLAGGLVSARVLRRRHAWEQRNNRIAICVDFDDAQAAAIRAGLPLDEMLHRLHHSGATHVSLPEMTLTRLQQLGQLTPRAPQSPPAKPAPVGHWNYLHGESTLVQPLAAELRERLPYTEAAVVENNTMVFAGDLPTIGEIGLGFDTRIADQIRQNRLGIVPRPVSYAWPEKALLERTLAQAAQLGRYVAFAGDMILGHEMHLDETVAAMAEHELSLVYFSQSRHQKGDWFVAKRRTPQVVLAHRFTPEEMVPLDYHAACHNWAHLARERGIRFCYVNFFRVLHATAPLEGLDYVHHLKHALEDAGFTVAADVDLPTPVPASETAELALTGVAAAGIGAAAVTNLLDLPETVSLPLTVVAAGGAAALPFVEKVRNQAAIAIERQIYQHSNDNHHHDDHHHHHEHDHHHDHSHDHGNLQALYPPSYAPKLLALAATALTPLAVQKTAWTKGLLYQMAAAVVTAASTSGPEYQLGIEAYKGFNLDWLLPLAGAAWQLPHKSGRMATLVGLLAAWLFVRRQGIDLLDSIDPGHAEGHTHHISAAMATVGDLQMALGPQPARKWAGLGPLAQAGSLALQGNGRHTEAALLGMVSSLGQTLGLVGFRQPERALQETIQPAVPSFAIGAAAGLLLLLGVNGRADT